MRDLGERELELLVDMCKQGVIVINNIKKTPTRFEL